MVIQKKVNSLLWAINRDDNIDSYLFGTMHVRDSRVFNKINYLKNLIIECQNFIAEIDMDTIDYYKYDKSTRLQNDDNLENLLKAPIIERLKLIVKNKLNDDFQNYNKYFPVVLTNSLTQAEFSQENKRTLDFELFTYAKSININTLGMESFDNQIEVISKIPLKHQLLTLKKIATNYSKFRKEIQTLSSLYLKEDIWRLYKKSKKSLGSSKRILLYNRNRIMSERIINISQSGKSFFAVGAAHLAGEKGILRYLKKEGFKISPLHV